MDCEYPTLLQSFPSRLLSKPRYTAGQFGHRIIDQNEAGGDIYQWKVILTRVEGQTSVNELSLVPKPSEMDAWLLHSRIVGEHIRASVGDLGYNKWRTEQDTQMREKEAWIRERALKDDFQRYRAVLRATKGNLA